MNIVVMFEKESEFDQYYLRGVSTIEFFEKCFPEIKLILEQNVKIDDYQYARLTKLIGTL